MILNKIDISVVIVNYNSADYLEQCIKSIDTARMNLAIEVIVVDNNSSDSPYFDKIQNYEYVKLIRLNENQGFAKANNIGVLQSNGDYIVILNPDTLLEPSTLSVMLDYMTKNQQVGISGCKVLNQDGTFQLACRRGFPTPWVSFTKLFGLQKLFPKSHLFARYNQTFRSIDDTYYIDSVIGAFMFIRRKAWVDVNGFDESFFMYGEDIDLCYRAQKTGWKIAYVHTTSIIHYKGVSTRRSSTDELMHFYSAMSIFSKKHFSGSRIFLLFLRSGIWIRKQLAKMLSNKTGFLVFLFDLLAINFSLLLATKIRFGGYFNFPDYAYPDVFIAISSIMILSMIITGEYLEGRHTVSKSVQSLLIGFFILSSLTYFFKDYAFSRGVVLMTVGFTIVLTALVRIIIELYTKIKGKKSQRRIGIIGTGQKAISLYNSLNKIVSVNSEIVGFIIGNKSSEPNLPAPTIGSTDYLEEIVRDKAINECIVTDEIRTTELFKKFNNPNKLNVRFHFVNEITDYIVSGIIKDIEGQNTQRHLINIISLKYRILKKVVDLLVSIITLTAGLPVILIFSKNRTRIIGNLYRVLIGRKTLIGLYGNEISNRFCRQGLFSLAGLGKPELINTETVAKLNEYYLLNYSFTLDLEIIFKYLLRKNRGNKIYS